MPQRIHRGLILALLSGTGIASARARARTRTSPERRRPVRPSAIGSRLSQTQRGAFHTATALADGRVLVAGSYQGKASPTPGDATTFSPRPSPVQVATLGTNVVEITAGTADHACARKADGTAWCWGRDDFGQLGDGTTTTVKPTPVHVANLGTSADQIAVSCAIQADGSPWCWGYNGNGEVGDGTTVSPRPAPVPVALSCP